MLYNSIIRFMRYIKFINYLYKGDVFMKFLVGADIGNDKMKVLEPSMETAFKMPNVYRKILKATPSQEYSVEKNVVNLLDQLVVHITSRSIRYSGLFAIGEKALETTEGLRNMDIYNEKKHKSDLPIINTLGYIAARAVQKDYEENKTLSKDVIEVDTCMSCAIPAGQHNAETAKHLEDRFTKDVHLVIVYVGDEQVTVRINFEKVKVTKEGIPALYAILEAQEDMFVEYKKEYGLENVTGQDFKNSRMMHNDIGSGTIEYVYTVGVNPRPNQCTGARYGVGHAIQNAIDLMSDERQGLKINRQQFAKIIENPEEYPKDKELALNCLREARLIQIDLIQTDLESKYNTLMNSEPEVITVYGGGSIEFKDDMYDVLKDFADSVNARVLWIPAKYAVDMNVKGLDILNRELFFSKEYNEVLENKNTVVK